MILKVWLTRNRKGVYNVHNDLPVYFYNTGMWSNARIIRYLCPLGLKKIINLKKHLPCGERGIVKAILNVDFKVGQWE